MPALAGKLLTVLGLLDPFAEADEDTGETKQSQNYIHIRIQRRSARAWLLHPCGRASDREKFANPTPYRA